MRSVNFGIDLGTTNSLIAKYEQNGIRIYKNPVGHKETLASIVAYRKDRILVGDKAREYLTKDAVNVFGGFKRRMGTDEKFYIVNLDENVTPIALSALILKELKTFVQDEKPEACVITVPASFDGMQSTATLKAGQEAGFKDVFLLQEPVAAGLAYFNAAGENKKKEDGYWLVYDFGGGTFDAALIKATADDLKVTDHEGNNFLGGMDLDALIINNIIVPAIAEQTGIENFAEIFGEKYGKYESLYYQAMYYAEEVKKELSSNSDAEIEFSAQLEGVQYNFCIPVSKADLDALFLPVINETITLLKKILTNNSLMPEAINEIILVGGSTYLSQVREQLALQTGIPVNFSIDPTTAIAVGAAYYAANKYYEPSSAEESETNDATTAAENLLATVDFETNAPEVELSYSRSSRDKEEVLLMAASGEYENKYYRISRSDGGFDTGYILMRAKKTEFLPLLPGTANVFSVNFYDEEKNDLKKISRQISIAQGMYSIDGQPLPHDVSVEIDDPENHTTKLESIFERNSLLPQKRTLYRVISKTIKKGSPDSLMINILEGDKNARPSSNLTIGCIEISGKDLDSDLIKGSDIEIKIELNDSRVLSTNVYLVMTQQEFKNLFTVSEKQVNIDRLKEQYNQLEFGLSETVRNFQYNENDIWEIKATALLDELYEMKDRLFKLKKNDRSDEKYIMAEKISRISQDSDKLGGNERISMLLDAYMYTKDAIVREIENADFRKEELRREFEKVQQAEDAFLRTKNASVIETKLHRLNTLYLTVVSNNIGYLINTFTEYKGYEPDVFKDYNAVKPLIKMADTALENESYEEFRRNVFSISSMLKKSTAHLNPDFKGTGIG